MTVKIFKEFQTKMEENKSRSPRGVLKPCQTFKMELLQTFLTAIHRQLFSRKAPS